MNKIHEIETKGLNERILELVIDGHSYSIDLAKESKKLAQATQAQLEDFTISPSGYGIHWPQVDEDLAIDPIIGAQHAMPAWKVAEDAPEYNTKKDEL
ncbi:DUF2442 domain-containing protein [Pontiella sulfatireligans]|uniref:DUF2442 domain-containing protein n=1 Tax=Pontiella sulfatireligans TaxID=2750658 RepID=A0A6C2UF27_9BACT|nr:DUF2442 domain-containing protein [Pontiella sulfatireligans]VGO17974.1 hypothetical protein SCARR_00024 [Pontiella sulfatireligans]